MRLAFIPRNSSRFLSRRYFHWFLCSLYTGGYKHKDKPKTTTSCSAVEGEASQMSSVCSLECQPTGYLDLLFVSSFSFKTLSTTCPQVIPPPILDNEEEYLVQEINVRSPKINWKCIVEVIKEWPHKERRTMTDWLVGDKMKLNHLFKRDLRSSTGKLHSSDVFSSSSGDAEFNTINAPVSTTKTRPMWGAKEMEINRLGRCRQNVVFGSLEGGVC